MGIYYIDYVLNIIRGAIFLHFVIIIYLTAEESNYNFKRPESDPGWS